MTATMEEIDFIFIQAGLSRAEQQGKERCKCATIYERWIHIDDELMERNGTLGVYAPEGPNSSEQLPIPAQ